MNVLLEELNQKESEIFRKWQGNIPEANDELNDLQREKINSVLAACGSVYIGKINHYGKEHDCLTSENVFKPYSGETVYNFEADFVIPVIDSALADMIVKWNSELPKALNLINRIVNRIDELGGANLIWS